MPTLVSSGYIQCNDVKHRKQYLHRVIWEDYYGKIPEGYEIHHKNGIKTDNRIENLELLKHKDHMAKHPKSKAFRNQCSKRFKQLWAEKRFPDKQNENHPRWKNLSIEKIVGLFNNGISPNEIAKYLSVDKSTIQRRLNLYGGCNYAL